MLPQPGGVALSDSLIGDDILVRLLFSSTFRLGLPTRRRGYVLPVDDCRRDIQHDSRASLASSHPSPSNRAYGICVRRLFPKRDSWREGFQILNGPITFL